MGEIFDCALAWVTGNSVAQRAKATIPAERILIAFCIVILFRSDKAKVGRGGPFPQEVSHKFSVSQVTPSGMLPYLAGVFKRLSVSRETPK